MAAAPWSGRHAVGLLGSRIFRLPGRTLVHLDAPRAAVSLASTATCSARRRPRVAGVRSIGRTWSTRLRGHGPCVTSGKCQTRERPGGKALKDRDEDSWWESHGEVSTLLALSCRAGLPQLAATPPASRGP